MYAQSNCFPGDTMQRWQEAGSMLSATLKNYLDSCCNLETAHLHDNARSTDLVSRIDSALDSLHVTLAQQLTQSRSTLARTRNRSASTLCRLSKEILTEILLDVIYVPTKHERKFKIEMGSRVQMIYWRLHALGLVCSVWRNVAVNCQSAWRVFPFMDCEELSNKPLTKDLSLQRGANRLYLSAIRSRSWERLKGLEMVVEHVHRFSSADIRSVEHTDLKQILSLFLESKHPIALSHLSIAHTLQPYLDSVFYYPDTSVPELSDYLVLKDSPAQTRLGEILQSLSVFCVSGAVFIHWDMITFSTRLTELCLHQITLGYDSDLLKFLRAASTARELRDLKIIA
ncbi:hypothetical protein V565_088160, partial [Rhizoctonia solani 123E]